MGWDLAVRGLLEAPSARAARRLRSLPFEVLTADPPPPQPFDLPLPAPPATVAAALDALVDDAFTATHTGSRLTMSGMWDDDALRDRAPVLVGLLAVAGRAGVVGEVELASVSGPTLAFRLTLHGGGVVVAALPGPEAAALAAAPWVADALEQAVQAALPPERGSSAAVAVVDEALTRLRALDDAALFACAADLPPGVAVRRPGLPVDQAWAPPTVAYPDARSLRAALSAPAAADWRSAFALPALAAHDPALAEPLALALLASDPPDELRESAVHALGHATSDAAVDALFAALARSSQASFALARCRHPGVAARAVAALDAAAVRELFAPAPVFGAWVASRPGRLLLVLAARRDPDTVPRLLEVWGQRGRSPAAQLVGSALIAVGTPAALAAAAEGVSAADPGVSRVGARAFFALDPTTAFERARPFFASELPAALRSAAAVLDGAPPDPCWLEVAASVGRMSPVYSAARRLLERAPAG